GETGRMLLRIVELPSLPQGQYFEVWSEQKPKPDRLVGLIKPPLRYDILYTLDSMINASALLVKGVANAQGKSLVVCQASIVE
ncbi:MAG: hypothetical protein ABIQ02_12055, partial [Saprospiraceae bacterium]